MRLLLLLGLLKYSSADLNVNCMVSDLWGQWSFSVGYQGTSEQVLSGADYTNLGNVTQTHTNLFTFSPQNLVQNDNTGSTGSVTFVYNQGFEFSIDNQVWWVNFYFNKNGYSCSKTSVGHVRSANNMQYARIQGTKVSKLNGQAEEHVFHNQIVPNLEFLEHLQYKRNDKFIADINAATNGQWEAKHYPENEKLTLGEIRSRSGVRASIKRTDPNRNIAELNQLAKLRHEQIIDMTGLPQNWDWRNISGTSFVSPVDDQKQCGSCYSFAAMGLLESRIRIQTNNKQQPIFSEQEVITCGNDKTYNQGCNGGFAFLNAGKYAFDFGIVEESCAPYNFTNTKCPDTSNCKRWYATDYGYLGGYYGATSDDGGVSMMQELYNNGPVAVGFNVVGDFHSYTNGVYYNTGIEDGFNPFVEVNHAVLCVGYGVCDGKDPNCGSAAKGTPYWIVKNSWGPSFGMGGYFYILRGVDECGIESMPFKSSMVLQY